jgi:hypothetical protein
MAGEFDPIKAIGEELAGLASVDQAFKRRISYAEAKLGEAEAELKNLRQIYGYLQAEMARKREVQAQLRAQQERAGGA